MAARWMVGLVVVEGEEVSVMSPQAAKGSRGMLFWGVVGVVWCYERGGLARRLRCFSTTDSHKRPPFHTT